MAFWTEDFDSYGDNVLPSDWNRDGDGTTGSAETDTGRSYNGSTSFIVDQPNSGSPSHWHVWSSSYSPTDDHTIEFYAYNGGYNGAGSAENEQFKNSDAGGNSSTASAWRINLVNDDGRSITAYDGNGDGTGTNVNLRNDIENSWIHILIDVEYTNNRYYVEINSTRYGPFGFHTNGSAVDFPVFNVQVDNYTLWFDEISAGPKIVAPSQPQNIAISRVTNHQVDLSWDPPSSWGGEEGSYEILRGQSSGSHSQIDTTTSTTYTDTGLVDGREYFYAIRAVNSAGVSSNSNEASAVTDLPTANFDNVEEL